MWEKIKNNRIVFFLFKAALLYLCWLVVYKYLIGPKTTADERLSTHIIQVSSAALETFGYDVAKSVIDYSTFTEKPGDPKFQLIIIKGGDPLQEGVWVGSACNGLSLFALFSIFIIAFPGSILKKLWFLPLGIVLIHLINIIRVFILAIIAFKDHTMLAFNHTYTFTIVVYAFIFALWMWWVNKYSKT